MFLIINYFGKQSSFNKSNYDANIKLTKKDEIIERSFWKCCINGDSFDINDEHKNIQDSKNCLEVKFHPSILIAIKIK